MVYSNSRVGTRTLIKTAVLCALSLSAIPSVHADGSLDASSSTAGDVCGISDGDKSVGIRVVDDASCSSGGLGCYNDHCRYCKILDTPQSTSFQDCATFGAEFPTMAPLVQSSGVCEVSSGDAAVGISAFTDTGCLYGGLGCFNDHCRFCKDTATAQSEAFVACPSNSTAGSATDSPTDTATSASSITVDSDGCTLVPAGGDVEVGISIGTDATCSAGGMGCINDVCRFCRIRTTTKSAAYTDCSLLGTAAPTETPAVTTETPAVVGETPASTTATPAVTETPAATTAVPDTTAETPANSTDVPVATTGAPVSSADFPVSTMAAPAGETTCSIAASVGDAAVGISIVTDPTCVSGGVGCMTDACRFCKVTTSTQSAAFMDCALFATDASTSDVPVADNSDLSDEGDFSTDDSDFTDASDADTAVPTTEVPVPTETPAATTATPDATTETPTPTATPDSTTATPDAITEAPVATTDATTEAPAGPTCSQTVSEGDAAVGIKIVTDASCSGGGAGCIDSVCRFCKATATPQSAAFVDCTSIISTATTAEAPTATDAVTEAPTEAPTDAPIDVLTDAPTSVPTDAVTDAPTEAPTGETCAQTVSEGDAAVGINIVTDTSCSAGGAGCIDNVCRFCKVTESTQSSAFVECTSIKSATSVNALTGNTLTETSTQSIADEATADILSGEQIGAAVAGCVGAIAAVAVVARAAKGSSARNANPNEPSDDDDEVDDTETGKRVSPGPVPTEEPATAEA